MTLPHETPGVQRSPRVRRPSAAVYRRRRLVVFGSVLALLALVAWIAVVVSVPLPSSASAITQNATISGETVSPSVPPEGTSAVVADEFGPLGAAPTHDVVPMASMTKTITALMVLKAHPLVGDDVGPTITFGQADVDVIAEVAAQNGNYSAVSVGDTTTERDALYAMMLNSYNNIASSLAMWAYGSTDEFLAQTAVWLAEQGLTDTVVADASGLNAESRSSSTDLIAIGRLARADPVLSSIVATPSIDLPLFGKAVNSNTLLGVSGINGIKTGTTDEAGSCLLYSATFSVAERSITLYGVTTGAITQTELQPAIADYVASLQSGFHLTTLADPGVSVATVTTPWETTSQIVPAGVVSALTWSDSPVPVTVVLSDIRGGAAGSRVGTMTVDTPEGQLSVDLVLATDLGDPGPGWRFAHVAQLFG